MEPIQRINGNDPESGSPDKIAENLACVKALFPEVVADGKVDVEVLRLLLGDVTTENNERFGLSWHGKRYARQAALLPSRATLRPQPEQGVDADTSRNIVIEGDNLEVLKLLQKGYQDRIKAIYIDPPYNTGRDFIYPDDFRDGIGNYLRLTGQTDEAGRLMTSNTEASGRFHTDWLAMMYPRLRLSRNLLSNDGAIFVSIGEQEIHNLRVIMDELFGPENFIATVIWQKVYSPKNSARHFSEDHDYVVVYARDADAWAPELLPRTDKQNAAYRNPDKDPRGPWKAGDLSARNYYGKGTYAITAPSGRVIPGPPRGSYWRISAEKLQELDADNRIWWGANGDNVPAIKRFLSEVQQGRVPQTIWPYTEVGHNQDAKKELLKRVEFEDSASVFDTPKPVKLIRRILDLATSASGGDIVLDFFAGSGTTGDAVLQANADDGGDRRFILVQLPEPTKAAAYPTVADITRARLRTASADLGSRAPMLDQGEPQDLGFRAYVLDSSNIRDWQPDGAVLADSIEEHIDLVVAGRSVTDLLTEVILKLGFDLCEPAASRAFGANTVYAVGRGELFACLDEEITRADAEAVALGIVAWSRELDAEAEGDAGPAGVVFRDAMFRGDDVAKANVMALLRQHGFVSVRSL